MSSDTAKGRAGEVFTAFLKLGLTSFGGPIAHLGYFRDELVVRRKWLDESAFADLVALCQFLPGPASSQVGFSLGVLRGNGLLGGLAAWFAFTMPSALILFAFAMGAAAFTGPVAEGFLHGLKLVAVAVVAQAIWGMSRTLTPDRARAGIALAAIAIVVLFTGSFGQIAAIALGACAGLWLCRGETAPVSGQLNFPVTRRAGVIALGLFAALLLIPPVIATVSHSQGLALFDAFYRSGALVFGGGHVVLPLLAGAGRDPGMGQQRGIPGGLWSGPGGAGTAVYFRRLSRRSDGTFRRTALRGPSLPWSRCCCRACCWSTACCRSGMRCAHALPRRPPCAAPTPPWSAFSGRRSIIRSGPARSLTPRDFALALAGFLLLTVWKLPPWIVVVLLAGAGILAQLL